MVSLNELFDQSGAKIEQIVSSLKQDVPELRPEHIASCVQEILETFQKMRESFQPLHSHFNSLDLERIPELRMCCQELLNSQEPDELVEKVSSRNRLEVDNYEYREVLLPSQVMHMETIWEWLNHDRVRTIGIEGEDGMGKKWMARQLKDRAIAANLFDIVIWIDSNLKNILECQEHIVDQLGLSITKKPKPGKRYNKKDLMQAVALSLGKKSYLLIVNDFRYNNVVLEDFGFSDPWQQNSSSKSKVLISGPKKCIDKIDKDKICRVGPLKNEETLLLFLGINGLDIDSPYVFEIAERFINRFKGIPSKIVSRDSGELTKKVCDLLNSGKMEVIDGIHLCNSFSQGNKIGVINFVPWYIGTISRSDECNEAYEKAHYILQKLTDTRYLTHNDTQACMITDENFKSKDSDIARADTEYLLIYGKQGCLPRTIPNLFFKEMQELITLAIVNAGIVSLPESLSNLRQLESLIIRGCTSLQNLHPVRGLQTLEVLRLRGASSLKEIPDDIFQNMKKLTELDLSKSSLKQLPLSISNLDNIHSLLLQGCSRLESIPSLKGIDKLKRLDLSGASALTSVPDINYSIEFLDLSGTLIESLPSPSNLKNLIQLFLRGCIKITTMPHPYEYKKLDVLDLSGATSFREFQGHAVNYAFCILSKFDLSGTFIQQVPLSGRIIFITKLLLRNCCHLETMPPLDFKLEVLDLSGSIAFKNFHDAPLPVQLRYLDLSKTQIGKLPMLSLHSVLVRLILRECVLLEELPHLELQRLQVLDLSGSTKFKTFKDDSFNKLGKLKTLNLSETQVANLPTLLQCSELRELILRKCLKLEELPYLFTLEKLELLDLSGALSFKQFKDESVGKKEELHELNLSETQVVQIPSLSECHNLRKLILRGCLKLEILPNLEALSRLIVLDLSGISTIKFHYQSTGLKYDYLQVLDLSGTHVSDLSFITGCLDLRKLSLRDCPNILTLPLLDELTRLEKLDLSRTETTELSFLSGCKSLIQLQMNDCSNIHQLTSLKEHKRLEVLDLSGTKVDDVSVLTGFNKLSQLSLRGCPNLKTLSFEGMQNLQKLDLSHNQIKLLPSSFLGIKNLQTLLLIDCSSLETLPHMEFLPKLEVLDLSCTTVSEFPNDISALTHLRFLKTTGRRQPLEVS